MSRVTKFAIALPLLAMLLLGSSLAFSQTLSVSAAISLKEAMKEIARQYESAGGEKVDLNFGASGTLAVQIEEGAPVDVFVSAGVKEVDVLIDKKLADASSQTIVAANRLVLIVPKDAKNPPTAFEDLTDARFTHVALGEPRVVPAGRYAMQTLKYLKLDDLLRPKLVMGENVRQVLSYVMRGEADAGMVYATDAVAAGDAVKVALIASEASHEPIVYPAVAITAGHRDEADKFLRYLTSDEARKAFGLQGFSLADTSATTRP
jgi:molybdate transport system substrate-binding protein